MITESQRSRSTWANLLTSPEKFDFFQAVRLLERAGNAANNQIKEDGFNPTQIDFIRFRADPSLSFPLSPIKKIERKNAVPEMTVSFMGLTGPSSVLPSHYTELMIQQIHAKDYAYRDFFELFNHRIISLFYLAWKKYHFFVGYEEPKTSMVGGDPFSEILHSLTGRGMPSFMARFAFPDDASLYYAGLLAQKPRSAMALKTLLCDYFDLSVTIKQYQGEWLRLSGNDCTKIASCTTKLGRYNQLGKNTVIGQRVWDVQGKVRIIIHSLTYAKYLQLLPQGKLLTSIKQFIRYFIGPEFDFDVQLILRASEVPLCHVSQRRSNQLGLNTWLKTREFEHDADDLILLGDL